MGRFGPKRAMVVMDRAVHESGFLRLLQQAFTDSDRKIGAVFPDIDGHATSGIAQKIAAAYRSSGSDCLIAIGGGPAMDAAKAAAVLAAAGVPELPAEIAPSLKLPKIFAVPVTYAPGFQVTSLCEVYDEVKKAPVYITNRIISSRSWLSWSPSRVEDDLREQGRIRHGRPLPGHRVRSPSRAQPVVTIYARACIELVRKFLPPVLDEKTRTKEADQAMANASLYAGIAFSHASQGIVAAAAHALKTTTGMESGLTASILLPWGLNFYAGTSGRHIMDLSGPLAGTTRFVAEDKQLGVVRDSVVALQRLTGLPETLRAAGIIQGQLKKAAQAAMAGPFHADGAFTEQDVLALLEKAF
jgi:alcohol dehydrogenase class IV